MGFCDTRPPANVASGACFWGLAGKGRRGFCGCGVRAAAPWMRLGEARWRYQQTRRLFGGKQGTVLGWLSWELR